jgi:hypothetical protein
MAADITSGKLVPGVRFEFWLQMLGRNRCLAIRDLLRETSREMPAIIFADIGYLKDSSATIESG